MHKNMQGLIVCGHIGEQKYQVTYHMYLPSGGWLSHRPTVERVVARKTHKTIPFSCKKFGFLFATQASICQHSLLTSHNVRLIIYDVSRCY